MFTCVLYMHLPSVLLYAPVYLHMHTYTSYMIPHAHTYTYTCARNRIKDTINLPAIFPAGNFGELEASVALCLTSDGPSPPNEAGLTCVPVLARRIGDIPTLLLCVFVRMSTRVCTQVQAGIHMILLHFKANSDDIKRINNYLET